MIIAMITFSSCSSNQEVAQAKLETGIWRAALSMQGQELPFNFEVTLDGSGNYLVHLINGDEKLEAGVVEFKGDSIYIPLGYFDTSLQGKITESGITGFYTKHFAEDYFIPFEAVPNVTSRFTEDNDDQLLAFDGMWEVTFVDPDEDTSYPAIGIFKQKSGKIEGTFLTRTGDYRYLEGIAGNNKLKLSTFDGAHAYLFFAELKEDGTLKGEYFSGKGGYKTWTAFKNPNVVLPDPEELTFLKEGYDKIEFTMPDLNGNPVSLDDPKYQGKVVILQIFGSWCPNCMDESKFLAPWYDSNKDRGVEIIGLAYENKEDFDYASKRVKKMVEKLKINYDFLIAGGRASDKASLTLPMLNKVFIYPTTIFIDRSGKVRRIHSGFSGPGTGKYYDQFVEDFGQFMDQLLQED